jgi:hypothetical protein
LIKEGGKELMKAIYECILKKWKEEITAHEWKYGIIHPIHKKVEMTMSDN